MSRKGKPRKVGKVVSDAVLRRMWEDMTLSKAEIGRRLGISTGAVSFRAKARKLPPRTHLRPFRRQHDHDRIVRLYRAGIAMTVVANLVGCTHSVVRLALKNAGEPSRNRHDRKHSISADKLKVILLAEAARTEQAALRLADMVDHMHQKRAA